MYNGIGLQTPRGSGTNGHVQRNFALVRKTKDKVNYKTEEEIAKLDSASNKQPNREILDHERKRKIELKCAELEDVLEQQGFSRNEVEERVSEYRTKLMDGDNLDKLAKDAFGKAAIRETHQLAEAQLEKNARLREAFGISSNFVEGSSLKGGSKQGPQQYLPIRTPSPELPTKKKKHRHSSSSPETKKDKKKKSKKSKKERSAASKKEKKKKRSRSSDSSASADSDSGSDSESEKERKRKKKKKRASRQNSDRDKSSESSPEKVVRSKPKKHVSEDRDVEKQNNHGVREGQNRRSREKDVSIKNSESRVRKNSKRLEKNYQNNHHKSNSNRSRSRERRESPKVSKAKVKHRSKSPKSHDGHTPDRTTKYSNNKEDKYSKQRGDDTRSPIHSRRNKNASPSPRRNRDRYKNSPHRRGYSPPVRRDRSHSAHGRRERSHSPRGRRDRSHSAHGKRDRSRSPHGRKDRSSSPAYKRRDKYYRSPDHTKDKFDRYLKSSYRDRSRSPRKSRRDKDSRRSPDKYNSPSSSPRRKYQSCTDKRKHRSPTPKRRNLSPYSKHKPSSSPKRNSSKSKNRSISPKTKNNYQSTKCHSPSPRPSKKNKSPKKSRSASPKSKKPSIQDIKDSSPSTVVKNRVQSRTPETSPPPKACEINVVNNEQSGSSKVELNGNCNEGDKLRNAKSTQCSNTIHNEVPQEKSPKQDKDKCSPSHRSRSSSSLSYSPARRSPERYKDVLDKLSEKDKSKYLKPNGNKIKSSDKDKKKYAFHEGRKSIVFTTIPVVRLHPSSSDEDNSETDDRRIDEEEDPQGKELDLLKIDLAFIAKESVKKMMEQRERDAAISSNNDSEKPSTSAGSLPVAIESETLGNINSATDPPIIKNEGNITREEIDREKEKLELEAKKRRLQTPDKSCSPSPARSRSRYSSLSSSSASTRKYSSASSRGSGARRSSSSSSFSESSHSSRSSHSPSGSASSRSHTSRSRSPSIPRRAGSPSFLDRRRITSARKRPIPYRRPTPSTHSSSSEWSSQSPSPRRHSTTPSPTRSSRSPSHVSPRH